jgi:hypothetical protein
VRGDSSRTSLILDDVQAYELQTNQILFCTGNLCLGGLTQCGTTVSLDQREPEHEQAIAPGPLDQPVMRYINNLFELRGVVCKSWLCQLCG